MKQLWIVFTLLCVGCFGGTPEQANLNRDTAGRGVELSQSEDPEVAAHGTQIVTNSETLDQTVFAGKATVPVAVMTPGAVAALNKEVREQHVVLKGFWGLVEKVIKSVPYGETAWAFGATAIAGVGVFLRGRRYRKSMEAGLRATDELTGEDGDVGRALKKFVTDDAVRADAVTAVTAAIRVRMEKEQNRSGVLAFVSRALEKIKG